MSMVLKGNSIFTTKQSMTKCQQHLWHYMFKGTDSRKIINADMQRHQLACGPPNVHFSCINHHVMKSFCRKCFWKSDFPTNYSRHQTQNWPGLELSHRADGLILKWSEMYIHHIPSTVQNFCQKLDTSQRKWH